MPEQKPKAETKKEAPKTVTYLVRLKSRNPIRTDPVEEGWTVKVKAPGTYRSTFGPLVPGTKGGANELAFRLYEGQKCRVLLRDAQGFVTDDIELLDENDNKLDPNSLYR